MGKGRWNKERAKQRKRYFDISFSKLSQIHSIYLFVCLLMAYLTKESPPSSAMVMNGGAIPPLPHTSTWCGV
jgi:hypothetical protein